jgi:hypothetical protein
MHLFKKSEDRHVLLNVGIDGILLLHQLMDHHLVVAIHIYANQNKLLIKSEMAREERTTSGIAYQSNS